MLKITVPTTEAFDEATETFLTVKEQTLELEHSLVSLSKWESKWNKPFLSQDSKTEKETKDYVRCMTINKNIDPAVYDVLTQSHFDTIKEYIDAEMTATTFSKDPSGRVNREVITSEIVYYWMIAQNIPFECQKWHLNRLLTLIQVCNIKNTPPKKMGKRDVAQRNQQINAMRKQNLGTGG